jgi:hypothetical protein
MSEPAKQMISISVEQASAWAESCIHMNHHQTLIQRELAGKKEERALDLSERSRTRAWKLFNELIAAGAKKPDGYCEPDVQLRGFNSEGSVSP